MGFRRRRRAYCAHFLASRTEEYCGLRWLRCIVLPACASESSRVPQHSFYTPPVCPVKWALPISRCILHVGRCVSHCRVLQPTPVLAQPSHSFRAQVGGALSRPAASFPLFEATVFEQFPYLLPCLLSSSLGLTTLVLCFFFLPETQAFVQRRAGAAQLPLSADTAPYNSIRVTRHETRADTATYHTTRAKPSSSRGAAHAACARATEPKQRRGALSA